MTVSSLASLSLYKPEAKSPKTASSKETPVEMETELVDVHAKSRDVPGWADRCVGLELKILRVHVTDTW